MKSAENRTRFRDANPLEWAVDRRVFLKRAMRSDFVVIACVGDQQPAQVSLAEDDGPSASLFSQARRNCSHSRDQYEHLGRNFEVCRSASPSINPWRLR